MYTPIAGFKANPQNINRKGAPKREWTMAGLLEEALEEQDETGTPFKKIITKKLRDLASKGDLVAIKEVNQRLDGMPKQFTDITSDGERIESFDPSTILNKIYGATTEAESSDESSDSTST